MPEFQERHEKHRQWRAQRLEGFPTRLTPPSNGVFERRSALFLYAQEVRMAKPDQIQDETLRTLVLEARAAYLGGQATESVHRSVDALLRLMHQHPDFIALQRRPGTAARVGRVWPGLGVKVELAADQPPRAVYERETFSTSEAITFYEFALESVIDAKL